MPGQTPQKKEIAIQPVQGKEVVIKPPTKVAKEVATQPAPLLHKPEQDQDTIDSQVSTTVDGQVQLRMVHDNILLSPLTLLVVQQASKPIEVAKDISTMPVDTAQGMSSDVPDLAQKEVATIPLDTAHGVSSTVPDLARE